MEVNPVKDGEQTTRLPGSRGLVTRIVPLPLGNSRFWLMVERNLMVYRHDWWIVASGFFEPLFYLLSIGVGVGQLVGRVSTDAGAIPYAAFVAPAMLASSAMNGAIADSTYNLFFKIRYAKLYDVVLATPMRPLDVAAGEIAWAQLRGGLYSLAFLITMLAMGLVHSVWALLAVPAALLLGFAFAAVGMAVTTWMRSWQDFEYITLLIIPMFLFSATFFPISAYPEALQYVVAVTPLYQGVSLIRGLTLGDLDPWMLVSVAYLGLMAAGGLWLASRRIASRLLT